MSFPFTYRNHFPRYTIILLLLSNLSFSQLSEPQPRFHNYTVDDGLPSSETYFVHQDRKGYIWICTDRGVSRFDGHTFRSYTVADGLTDNVVFSIYEDYKGRLWFVTFNSMLCYFENEKIYPYKYNHIISKRTKSLKTAPQKQIYIDKSDKLYMSIYMNGLFTIDKAGNFKRIQIPDDKLVVSKYDGHSLWSLCRDNANIIKTMFDVYYDKNGSRKKVAKIMLDERISLADKGNETYMLIEDNLYSLDKQSIVHQSKNAISLYLKGNDFWIGSFKNGVEQITDISHPEKKSRYLDNFSVSSVLCDLEGGYWFSTLENGIFYTPSLSVKNYTVAQGLLENDVISISGIENEIYVGFLLGKWQNLYNPKLQNVDKIASRVLFGNSGKHFYLSANGTYRFSNGKQQEKIYEGWGGDFYPIPGGVVFGNNNVMVAHDDGSVELIYSYIKDDIANRRNAINALMLDRRRQLWVGEISGLCAIKNGHMSIDGLDDPRFKVRVADLLYTPEWKNVVATRGEGIYFFEDKRIFTQLKKKDGLLSDLINCLYLDPSGGIWVGTNKGLNFIRKENGKIKIESFTTGNGLISNEISSLYIYNGKVYAGTKAGLSVIDTKSYVRNHFFPKVYIIGMETGSQQLDCTKHHVFRHQEPYIKIRFRNTNYKTQGKTLYRYRFKRHSEWITTDHPEVILISPISGDYDLEISYRNEDGIWSPSQSLCTFTIDEAFYNKWYFFAGMTLLLGLVAWRVFRFRIKQLKQRHVLNDKISQLEQKALQAQMNPHFIFNALNSIQSFLVYEENEKAEKYLLKFAKLIRQTLNNSREQYITLESEISTLQKYLDLEQMRFKNKFTWRIENRLAESDLLLKIPNMLIQPFVENAVIHGFSTLDSGGLIVVRLESVDGSQIRCTVEDNGIGRRKAAEQSSKKHVSHGVTITEERLRAFESKHGISFKIETIDLENEDGTTGTCVIINLPAIHVSEIE